MTKKTRPDSSRGAMIKGAIIGVAAQFAFAGLFLLFFDRSVDGATADQEGGSMFLLTFHTAALVPTLLAGAGLGFLARRSCGARTLVLISCALLACIGVFAVTFGIVGAGLTGLWMGVLFAVIFGVVLAPIGVASGVALAVWVRPASPSILGEPT